LIRQVYIYPFPVYKPNSFRKTILAVTHLE
jgi:hypothetical protein